MKARMRRAWAETDYPRALEQLQRLADELKRTLESTNPAESMIDTVRTTQRNVKHRSSGEMGLRWTAAGIQEAEKQFRKVIGYLDLPRLAITIERRLHLHQPNPVKNPEAAIAITV